MSQDQADAHSFLWKIAGDSLKAVGRSIKGRFTSILMSINAQDKIPSEVTTTGHERLIDDDVRGVGSEIDQTRPCTEASRSIAASRESPRIVGLAVSADERERKKRELKYEEGFFHCAVAGVPGSGKSSLLNALRGLRNNELGSAPTGIMEKTSVTIRYVDQNTAMHLPFAWYDIPGAGSLTVPEWTYFKDQGMYIFDAVIVLVDTRFTETDIAILRNCKLYRIPAFIVRSKANQHIRNIVDDLARQEDESDSQIWERARQHFIRRTKENIRRNLEGAQLPPMKVYIVDKEPMVQIVMDWDHSTETKPSGLIHEEELWLDLVKEAGDKSRLIK
ncbi:uncharacterized protein LAESUDRAFT_815409 [Laetiporus sulphureus 93-53]|uniref:IRG-type G domain-containing protein n=1 Tax=Laetiporus sulphureus 93-53 TaxID=1314785 RepID=A0A165C8G1_9APHY|nr:uncharacterized protein LAESUDRAFT_815409 [Laetiporus sulphureus 93-53]KZT02382.1 hypothetical protein LAESUDRAFT_815409 [Laetiporus sulphureus 93-53]